MTDDSGMPPEVLAEMSREAIDLLLEEHRAEVASSRGSADQGARPGPRRGQLTREDLKGMTPDQINQARREGRCDRLLGRDL